MHLCSIYARSSRRWPLPLMSFDRRFLLPVCVSHPTDYADYDPKLDDEDYWYNEFESYEGEDGDSASGDAEDEEDFGSAEDSEGDEEDDEGRDTDYGSIEEDFADDDEGDVNFESSLGSWALYKIMPSISCLDPTVA